MENLPSLVLGNLITGFVYFLPLFILIAFIKSPYFKGKIGEGVINLATTLKLDNSVYHLLKDITVPIASGTTQIDHVIVSKYGIFVIETKNLKGWIFGGKEQKYWTQKIYKNTT